LFNRVQEEAALTTGAVAIPENYFFELVTLEILFDLMWLHALLFAPLGLSLKPPLGWRSRKGFSAFCFAGTGWKEENSTLAAGRQHGFWRVLTGHSYHPLQHCMLGFSGEERHPKKQFRHNAAQRPAGNMAAVDEVYLRLTQKLSFFLYHMSIGCEYGRPSSTSGAL